MRFASTHKTSTLSKLTGAICVAVLTLALANSANAQQVIAKVGGDGVVGADSVKAGAPFTIDIWMENGGVQKGFTLGFALSGKNGLKSISHGWSSKPTDSAFNPTSNILAFNGFEDASIWDMGKLMKKVTSWDGNLPDTTLIGGVSMNKSWEKNEMTHYVSFAVQANEAGTICVDSAYVAPGGAWLFAGAESSGPPKWDGPYCFTVVAAK